MFLASGMSLGGNKKSYDGSRGWVGNLRIKEKEVSSLDFVNTVMVHKVEHHFPIIPGYFYEELQEVGFWLEIKALEMVPYRCYAQGSDRGEEE